MHLFIASIFVLYLIPTIYIVNLTFNEVWTGYQSVFSIFGALSCKNILDRLRLFLIGFVPSASPLELIYNLVVLSNEILNVIEYITIQLYKATDSKQFDMLWHSFNKVDVFFFKIEAIVWIVLDIVIEGELFQVRAEVFEDVVLNKDVLQE